MGAIDSAKRSSGSGRNLSPPETDERPATTDQGGDVLPFRKGGFGVKVAVLKGGRSFERGVSLRSGARVQEALARLGHEVVSIDAGAELVEDLTGHGPEIAFVAMHGPGGEDGTVQELLEILGIPFTGPGVAACIRCIDKALAKHELRAAGVPTPDWLAFNETAFRELGAAKALDGLEERLGLSAGRQAEPRRVGARGEVRGRSARRSRRRWSSAFSYDDRVLLERFVDGRELAVERPRRRAAAGRRGDPDAGDRYDFEARYEIGRTSFICPAELTARRRRPSPPPRSAPTRRSGAPASRGST